MRVGSAARGEGARRLYSANGARVSNDRRSRYRASDGRTLETAKPIAMSSRDALDRCAEVLREESVPCLLHSRSAPRPARRRFALYAAPNSFRLRLARGSLLLLPEEVNSGVAVTLIVRNESRGSGEIDGQRARSQDARNSDRGRGTLKPPRDARVENPSRPRLKCFRYGRRTHAARTRMRRRHSHGISEDVVGARGYSPCTSRTRRGRRWCTARCRHRTGRGGPRSPARKRDP